MVGEERETFQSDDAFVEPSEAVRRIIGILSVLAKVLGNVETVIPQHSVECRAVKRRWLDRQLGSLESVETEIIGSDYEAHD